MTILVPTEVLGGSQSIPLGNTYRYISSMPNFGFRTISYWTSRGLTQENHCGQGHEEYSSACIPCSVSFSGNSSKVVLTIRVYVTNSKVRTFRWGITSSRYDSYFRGPAAAPSSVVLAQGKFTPDHAWGAVHDEKITMPVSGLPSTFYIYLWRTSATYGNMHISGTPSVQVYSYGGDPEWKEATPYLWVDGRGWVQASPYIMRRNPSTDQKEWVESQ